MAFGPKEVVLRVLRNAKINAEDDLARAENQAKRTPNDKDLLAYLKRAREHADEISEASKWVSSK